jgi:hypothetical protein
MQPLFLDAWQKLYPDMIAWKSLSNGGNVASIDVAKKSIETDFDTYEYAVANVIPPQKAGRIAALAGVVDRTGWCPVDAVTFESQKQKDIHVIGDSAFAGTMPKSAFSGLLEGKLCAAAIARLFAGATPEAASMSSNCYSVVAPGYAISITGEFRPVNGEYTEVDNSIHSSPLDAPPTLRAEDAKKADAWFRTATTEIFG